MLGENFMCNSELIFQMVCISSKYIKCARVMNDKNCEVTGRHPLQLIETRLTFAQTNAFHIH